jgi:hypothetical protein
VSAVLFGYDNELTAGSSKGGRDRRRHTTSGPLVVAMLGAQIAIAGLAVYDSPSTALMLFH